MGKLAFAGSDPGLPPPAVPTLLLVEDSVYAADAIRLACRHVGLRLRRAASLAEARRHLGLYRPHAVMIDVGLPDGSGAELVAALAAAPERPRLVIATSAESAARAVAEAAGADLFLEKPVSGIRPFQRIAEAIGSPGRPASENGSVTPDAVALHQDLARLDVLIGNGPASAAYAAQFAEAVARAARDGALAACAARVRRALARPGQDIRAEMAALRGLVRARLAATPAI